MRPYGSGKTIPFATASTKKSCRECLISHFKHACPPFHPYVIDPDNYHGGRKQTVTIAGQSFGPIANFQEGRWIERPLGRHETAEGKVLVRATNAKKEGNAVISIIEWMEKKQRPAGNHGAPERGSRVSFFLHRRQPLSCLLH